MFSRKLGLSVATLCLALSGWTLAGGSPAAEKPSHPQGGKAVSAALRAELLQTRESVWKAWFENNQEKLKMLVPGDVLAINAAEEEWENQKAVLESATKFSQGRGKLISLSFPRTEIQHFGEVAILYSIYAVETEEGGARQKQTGRATEIFVRRAGQWVNPGWHLDSGK